MKIDELCVSPNSTILEALNRMDTIKKKLLIIKGKSNNFINLISIGDIQRSIIKGHALTERLSHITIDKKIVASTDDTAQSIKALMATIRAEFMPVLNKEGELADVIFWSNIALDGDVQPKIKNEIPVVIMAGGKGTRLKPLSNIIPKPLIPIGEDTILEEIINRFENAGTKDFYLSVNYKKEMIEYYLNSVGKSDKVQYFSEVSPLGTAGSLSLLKGKLSSTFYVTNCDILIDQDLNELYEYHVTNKNEITLVAALKQMSIPYGTLEAGENGLLVSMQEKPDFTFKINAGVYLLEPHLLNEIPENEFFHITQLIENVKDRGGRVGVFPISEKSWLDIGEWPEYVKTVRGLKGDGSFKGL
ncbi:MULTISPECIES: nucleotidyltransferase family protein [unclassified Pseudoalteromonas]|jgi:dTDP-glucose pyrophosphorylase|uniref:nucleotidyltransferase family protein n=1 Tax=unclassified Pseudoalteromonas TaxID=194690 RepID=UPI001C004A8B|nr:nucleotidyltransferase family protein [Pseudoalteromonas sp. SiA1]QWF33143.1 nucleotidyltransferase family protein [Pseudoalteromonas sp. SiA1]